jgi:hypothetical protein
MPIIGTCSKCNGPVQVPDLWGGTVPPVPTCAHCGATAKDPYGPTIPMETCHSSPVGVHGLVRDLVREIERNTCTHEETHRGGALWEICDLCGAKWADDRGGKPEFQWPDCIKRAHEWLAHQPPSAPEAQGGGEVEYEFEVWQKRLVAGQQKGGRADG